MSLFFSITHLFWNEPALQSLRVCFSIVTQVCEHPAFQEMYFSELAWGGCWRNPPRSKKKENPVDPTKQNRSQLVYITQDAKELKDRFQVCVYIYLYIYVSGLTLAQNTVGNNCWYEAAKPKPAKSGTAQWDKRQSLWALRNNSRTTGQVMGRELFRLRSLFCFFFLVFYH